MQASNSSRLANSVPSNYVITLFTQTTEILQEEQGLSVSEACQLFGISRQTLWEVHSWLPTGLACRMNTHAHRRGVPLSLINSTTYCYAREVGRYSSGLLRPSFREASDDPDSLTEQSV
jgi:hypothetical protein